MSTREVMNIEECAEYLGVSVDTMYNYAAQGTVPSFKIGNRWKFKKSRLDQWMLDQEKLVKPKKQQTIKCCERDVNNDGNCDVHSAPGIFRKYLQTEV